MAAKKREFNRGDEMDLITEGDPLRHKAIWGGTPFEGDKYADGDFIKVYHGQPTKKTDSKDVEVHWSTSPHVATRFAQFGTHMNSPMSISESWLGERGYHAEDLEHGEDVHEGHRLVGLVHRSDVWDPHEPGAREYFRKNYIFHPDDATPGETDDITNKNEREVTIKKGAPVYVIGETHYTYDPDKPNPSEFYDQSKFTAKRIQHPALGGQFYRANIEPMSGR
jgi:hypothetical protein